MKQAVLEVKGLTKYFGDVAANKDISLSLDKHEILAIVGENGAGKSTFCKMLTGIYHPDKGSIVVEGEEVARPMIFVVVKNDEEITKLSSLVKKALGDLKNKGFMYALPISYLEGLE